MDIGRNSRCTAPIEMWHPIVTIGNYSTIAKSCVFMGAANHPSVGRPELVANYPFKDVFRDVPMDYPTAKETNIQTTIIIGNDVWVGYECLIRGGTTIGDGAIVGMGAVVTRDVPPYAVAVGNPCEVKKFRFPKDVIEKLLKIKWWDWDDKIILERMPDFLDVNKFIKKYYN